MQAIIFLAPLTFNLTLEEDPTVNRIEDSMVIWKAICSNKLLERTAIILFLNKMDVLAAALESGLRVKDYVTSYGELANDVPTVAKCMSHCLVPSLFANSYCHTDFKEKFRIYHVRVSTPWRTLSR